MFEFHSPKLLWLLLILIPFILYDILYKEKKKVRLNFSRLDLLKKVSKRNSFHRFLPLILRSLILTLLIFSLARPRYANKKTKITGKGIDIVVAVDVSGSMQAVDFKPDNRLEAAKEVAKKFIEERKNDRIGITVFSDHSFTQCPLTLDYDMLMQILDSVEIDQEAEGTAIGMGLATAVARMAHSEAKSKVIILVTDGVNNTGEIDPITAANLASTYGIKVYTIGVGKKGLVDFPQQYRNRVSYRKVNIPIDMETLDEIARITGTERAYRAHNTEEFDSIFKQINKMEKSEIKIDNYFEYKELFNNILLLALLLLIFEVFYRVVWVKELP